MDFQFCLEERNPMDEFLDELMGEADPREDSKNSVAAHVTLAVKRKHDYLDEWDGHEPADSCSSTLSKRSRAI
jgi:hypothetical protein